jgi:hypothetical protein
MEIGIGLPNAIQDVDSDSLLEFAKKADARGFTSLGSTDRIARSKRCGKGTMSARSRPARADAEQADLLADAVGK